MELDLVLGLLAIVIGTTLTAFSAPLARGLREGDDRWRERHPWTACYEPQAVATAGDHVRYRILRAWLLCSAGGFVAVGAGLVLRAGAL